MLKHMKIPLPSLKRYSSYLAAAEREPDNCWISTSFLSNETGMKAITIRKDIAYLDIKGVPKKGYPKNELIEKIKYTLGGENFRDLVIVGSYGLGEGFIKYPGLISSGYKLRVAFDFIQEEVLEGEIPTYPIERCSDLIPRLGASVAILSVEDSRVDGVVLELEKLGIKGIVNLTNKKIGDSTNISVVDFNLLNSLSELSGLIKM